MMFSRAEVLAFINTVIEDNHGNIVTEGTIVRESGIDSFGFAVLFLELDEEYECFSAEYVDKMYKTLSNDVTVKELIDRVTQCS